MRSTIVRATGCLVGLAMVLGLSACGDGGGSGVASGPGRYCSLVAELTKLGSAAYDKVAADSNATDADYVAANKAFFESSQAKFDEMVQVVPTEIKADVQTVVDSIRGQAGLGAEVPTDDTTAAEERVKTYEDAHC